MAKLKMNGLRYFPLDSDLFDDSVMRRMRFKFGNDALTYYMYLLCRIYKKEGYYLRCNDDFLDIASMDMSIEPDELKEMTDYMVEKGLFDAALYREKQVLTSPDIQLQFQESWRGTRRSLTVKKALWMLDEDHTLKFIRFDTDRLTENDTECMKSDMEGENCRSVTDAPTLNCKNDAEMQSIADECKTACANKTKQYNTKSNETRQDETKPDETKSNHIISEESRSNAFRSGGADGKAAYGAPAPEQTPRPMERSIPPVSQNEFLDFLTDREKLMVELRDVPAIERLILREMSRGNTLNHYALETYCRKRGIPLSPHEKLLALSKRGK